ncbi:TetR/AcrR family transcriptional regulator [Streptomyces sp. JJ36]|uniref:TetR/AcrR family transcriptional regulator n=1 Tax=Streptomyces sp. JJ36 TaxID=2736645 RepID=UPI001F22995A|nr:TetR/AcrR family transcriptional regulator [Streptomyces sp. JJ36]MCF6522098.1 TetR/AcrR family transcriptional regulator [Streptomyces sp. JJ36]
MTPTSAERGQESRTKLLDAAAQLIVEEGWGGVTTRKVADRAGLRAGLVHYHFASVNDLLIDAALDRVRREVEVATLALAEAADPATGVDQILEQMAAYSSEDPATILFSEMLLASTRHERLRRELAALLAEWRGRVAQWLASSGVAEDNEATALLLGAAIDGLVLHRLVDPALAEIPVTGALRRLVGLSGPSPQGAGTTHPEQHPEQHPAGHPPHDGTAPGAPGAPGATG